MFEFIFLTFVGIIFLIYSLLCSKRKKVIYTISSSNFNVIDNRYFDLQSKISVLNSVLLIIGGITSLVFINKEMILFGTIFVFWMINYALKWAAISKKLCSNKNN